MRGQRMRAMTKRKKRRKKELFQGQRDVTIYEPARELELK